MSQRLRPAGSLPIDGALASQVFFGGRRIVGGLGVIGGMVAAALGGFGFAREADRPAALTLAPLAAWLAFAGAFNEWI